MSALPPAVLESPGTLPGGAPARLGGYWQGLAPRERAALGLAAAALLLLLVWLVALAPALRTLREAPAEIDRVDAELQVMQALAAETTRLRATPPVSNAQAVAALKAATERLGSKGRLIVQGDRATLNLNGTDTDALRKWLELARSAARGRPIEAQLSRDGSGYSGTLVLSLGTAP